MTSEILGLPVRKWIKVMSAEYLVQILDPAQKGMQSPPLFWQLLGKALDDSFFIIRIGNDGSPASQGPQGATG